MPLERVSSQSVPMTRMKPVVTGGICEYCGVLDGTKDATEQYKLCPHFKDIGELRCSYCPDSVDPVEVIRSSKMKVHEHPDKPNVWIALCDRYNCTLAHERRFVRNL